MAQYGQTNEQNRPEIDPEIEQNRPEIEQKVCKIDQKVCKIDQKSVQIDHQATLQNRPPGYIDHRAPSTTVYHCPVYCSPVYCSPVYRCPVYCTRDGWLYPWWLTGPVDGPVMADWTRGWTRAHASMVHTGVYTCPCPGMPVGTTMAGTVSLVRVMHAGSAVQCTDSARQASLAIETGIASHLPAGALGPVVK